MTHRFPFAAAASVLALSASGALAQVTAEEAWAGVAAQYEALGVSIDATVIRDGSTVTISGITGTWPFPLGFGSLTVRTGDVVMTEGADGTVVTSFGSNWPVFLTAVARDGSDEGSVKVELLLNGTNHRTVISGTPDAISYASTWDRLDLTLGQYGFGGELQDAGQVGFDMFLSIEGGNSTTTIEGAADEGTGVAIRATGFAARLITNFGITMEGQTISQSVSENTTASWNNEMIIPDGGIDILNIGPALRAGFLLVATGTSGASRSESTTSMDGSILSSQTQTIASMNQSFRLDQTGIDLVGTITGTELSMSADMLQMLGMPTEASVSIETASSRFAMPLLATGTPSEAQFLLSLTGFDLSDGLWNLIFGGQPGLQSPAELVISATGNVLPRRDLTDVLAVAEALDSEQVVAELQNFNVLVGPVRWAGAEATGAMSGTFDWTGVQRYSDLDAPTGTGSINLTGINALLDQLAAAGVLQPQDAMMARAGLGAYLRATGPDALSGDIVFSPDSFTVNGQPLE